MWTDAAYFTRQRAISVDNISQCKPNIERGPELAVHSFGINIRQPSRVNFNIISPIQYLIDVMLPLNGIALVTGAGKDTIDYPLLFLSNCLKPVVLAKNVHWLLQPKARLALSSPTLIFLR